jgi:ATP-dependent RNA helicase DOB1
MAELIARIQDGENVETSLLAILDNLHSNGPVDNGDLEILSYIKLYQPVLFSRYEKTILNLMGLFFKNNLSEDNDLRGMISNIFGKSIVEKYGHTYTPVQANLLDNITDNRLFSFSSATSTGKSHVFRDLILNNAGDMVIIVPSRALINEYFTRTLKLLQNKPVNVLVFPDIVNTAMSERNVFILTPERVKDLFKLKERLNIQTVLFDEAQLAEEEGRRGIYFDSIVRRVNEHFSNARMLFAQPYIDNPEAQFIRNKLSDTDDSISSQAYPYRNVGQVFTCFSDEDVSYYHFAIDKVRLGGRKVALGYDPIERCLENDGSVLVYVSKASIYNNESLDDLSIYIDKLEPIVDRNAKKLISKITELLGGSSSLENPYHSDLLSLLERGIVIHHGSLPLQARFLIEEFINDGYCRICFATSTLYQGVNMPFDIVYLKRLDGSKPLLVKNLIGRAGRSTQQPVFDFGQVIVNLSGMSTIRNILAEKNTMSDESQIDVDNANDDADLVEFKDAIRNNELNDQYNLTDSQIERLGSSTTNAYVADIIEILFSDSRSINEIYSDLVTDMRIHVIDSFKCIFRQHVKGRELSEGEAAVIESAVQIFISQIGGRNLKSIIESRFSYIAQVKERRGLELLREQNPTFYQRKLASMKPRFTMPAEEIPNKDLSLYGLFPKGTQIKDAGYDRVMYDTYDYIDKVWGFYLADIFFAAFDLYFSQTLDLRAQTMCKYIRYATTDEVEIWLLRYGFSFEEIEWIKPLIIAIDETRIRFGDTSELNKDQLGIIARYLVDKSEHES